MKEKNTILLHLKSGQTFVGEFAEDELHDIYDSWKEQRKFMVFSNGEFLTSEVAGISWGN